MNHVWETSKTQLQRSSVTNIYDPWYIYGLISSLNWTNMDNDTPPTYDLLLQGPTPWQGVDPDHTILNPKDFNNLH